MKKQELIDNMCEMVKNILPEEEHDNDVIANYTDTLVMIAEEYNTEKLKLHGVSNCAKVEDKPTPLNWLLRDKLGIEKGTTYVEPKLTVRQCASWISEYVKKHCC